MRAIAEAKAVPDGNATGLDSLQSKIIVFASYLWISDCINWSGEKAATAIHFSFNLCTSQHNCANRAKTKWLGISGPISRKTEIGITANAALLHRQAVSERMP